MENYSPELVARELDDLNDGNFKLELEYNECMIICFGNINLEGDVPLFEFDEIVASFEDETEIELPEESIREIREQFNEIYK